MSTESLVRMANDIATYFASEPDRETAIEGIAAHVRRFWAPRMRREILAHLADGGEGLDELAREALRRMDVPASA